jgi:transcriptional regulator with XRE-family HTH domain
MSIYQQALDSVSPRETYMNRLRITLTAHAIPHARLAMKAGICPTQLSRWFAARQTPSLESMLRLNEALDKCLR